MRRLAIRLCLWTATALAFCSTGRPAFGQAPPAGGEAPAAPPAGEPAAEPPREEPAGLPPSSSITTSEVAAARTPTDAVQLQGERWRDIMVLPRRPVLKSRRVELVPMYHFSFNNPLITSHALGAQINYFLSEALWLGVHGQYYIPQQSNTPAGSYFLIGAQDKVLPAVNKLVFSALLDFGYVPAYGKFALFNRTVIHWEGYVTLGVGVFMSEVIPVKRNDPAFQNLSAIFDVGVGSRLFLTRWLALNAFLKLYGYPDTFEPVANSSFTRDPNGGCSTYFTGLQAGSPAFADKYAQCRKDKGSTSLALDVVFGLGLSFFLPPKFDYKLQR